MNTQKTYRFFTLLLAYLVAASAVLANVRVLQQEIAVKVNLGVEKSKKEQISSQKATDQDHSKESLVQQLESLAPSLSISLIPVLNLIRSIEFPTFEYRIYYHKPPIALLPYFENVFAHFIVINAP